MGLTTMSGAFNVDQDGVRIAQRLLLSRWLDGKK
jgi:hypothetical protein